MRHFTDIGKMDRLITIRNQSAPVANDYGETVSATNTDTTLNAAYSYAGKDETDLLDKQTNIKYEYFVIRYGLATVNMRTQLIYESNTYDIVNIEPIGRERFLKIKAKLVV
ncbi:MAG TPA: head-tail adaptor protein [Saprospiraceae bacterium]|nr:head-tail adaptor protein [Saprospiraceae bacterium]